MRIVSKKIALNSPGKYYVTSECNGCGICFMQALANFMYTSSGSKYFIYRQPLDKREETPVRRLMELCPMGCIKDDGDLSPAHIT